MHPAPSLIAFSTLSGLGFGLMLCLGMGFPGVSGWVAFTFWALAYALAVGGLLSSVMHLANKRNAIKAFSQWRSSWLSREGILAVATLLLMAPLALMQIFFGMQLRPLGLLAGLLAVATVFSTSMIYAQLRTVPRWHSPFTPVLFLGHMLAGGTLLAGQARAAALLLVILGLVQIAAWMRGDARAETGRSTIATATGLGRIGTPRQFEAPHSGSNYLLDEMAYKVARKHVPKLRVIAVTLGTVLPAALLTLLPVSHVSALFAVLSYLAGTLTARWLFFAEARHVVGLYYGR